MTLSHRFIIVSGIPGCGKSTVARALAGHLNMPYFDKDEILESLFEESGCSDAAARHRLSRAADQEFQVKALNSKNAVLDSFWRHPSADSQSGTPSGWLNVPEVHAVEVFCSCPPELAATRFLERKRHAGHLDGTWNHASLVAQSANLIRQLPLGVGTLIEINTAVTVDIKQLVVQVRTALDVDPTVA